MIANRISTDIPFETEVLPFPLQTRLLGPLKAAALAQGKTEMISFWSGQNAGSLKHHSSEQLMRSLIEETSQITK